MNMEASMSQMVQKTVQEFKQQNELLTKEVATLKSQLLLSQGKLQEYDEMKKNYNSLQVSLADLTSQVKLLKNEVAEFEQESKQLRQELEKLQNIEIYAKQARELTNKLQQELSDFKKDETFFDKQHVRQMNDSNVLEITLKWAKTFEKLQIEHEIRDNYLHIQGLGMAAGINYNFLQKLKLQKVVLGEESATIRNNQLIIICKI